MDGHQHVHVLPGAWVDGPRPGAVRLTPRWGGKCSQLRGRASSDSAPPTGVCQVFAEALQAHGVRFTRLPLERGVGGCTWLEAPARAFACAVERDARAAVGPFSRRGLRLVPLPSLCPAPCPAPIGYSPGQLSPFLNLEGLQVSLSGACTPDLSCLLA